MTRAALVVEDLTVRVGSVPAVTDLSLTLAAGTRTGLIGESGSGKTLTALALLGLLPDGITARGRVWYRDTDLLTLSERELCRLRGDRLAMVFQEPMTALNPVMKIGDQVAEPLRVHRGMSRSAALRTARELLEHVQLPDVPEKLHNYPHQLSGGQRQRAMIAMAMACTPDILIADEPTTALDVTVQAQILELLGRLVDENGATLLLITHDLAVVANVCERVLVLYGGRLVEQGGVREVFGAPLHPYTRALMDAIPPLEPVSVSRKLPAIPGQVPGLGQFPAGCPFRTRCPRADGACAEMPPLTGAAHRAACWHPLDGPQPARLAVEVSSLRSPQREHELASTSVETPAASSHSVYTVEHAAKHYRLPRTRLFGPRREIAAVDDVSFTLARDETLAIVGESGSGKTTLMKLLLGLERPDVGSVTYHGASLQRDVQVVFQDPASALDPRMRVGDIIREPLRALKIGGDHAGRVRELLDAVGLSADAVRRYPHEFSGGQRQRIAIARALAPRPRVLIGDEPVSALDVSVRAQILNLLEDLRVNFQLTLVLVSHDLSVVRHMADRVLVMQQGRIVERGVTADVFTHPTHAYTRLLLESIPRLTVQAASRR